MLYKSKSSKKSTAVAEEMAQRMRAPLHDPRFCSQHSSGSSKAPVILVPEDARSSAESAGTRHAVLHVNTEAKHAHICNIKFIKKKKKPQITAA